MEVDIKQMEVAKTYNSTFHDVGLVVFDVEQASFKSHEYHRLSTHKTLQAKTHAIVA